DELDRPEDARCVDQDRGRPELCLDVFLQQLDIVGTADVGAETVGTPRDGGNLGAARGERCRDIAAQAARAAGDHGDLAAQVDHRSPPPARVSRWKISRRSPASTTPSSRKAMSG